jgi:ABC-2 type transport system ATP-binding protein
MVACQVDSRCIGAQRRATRVDQGAKRVESARGPAAVREANSERRGSRIDTTGARRQYAAMGGTCLELHDVRKSFHGRPAVDGISLSIVPGEIFGLLGPNGAGKSTTINMLATFLRPTSGEILWDGRSIYDRGAEWRKAIGVVLEELSLFEYLTVREHFHLTGRLYGLSPDETARRAEELLAFLRLEEFASITAREASQGTRKKLAFGLSIIHGPRFLFLDEALNGIDAVVVKDVKELLRRLAARGTAIVISSHVLDVAQTLIDRCVIVDAGVVALDISRQRLLESGRSLEEIYTDAVGGPNREGWSLSWA